LDLFMDHFPGDRRSRPTQEPDADILGQSAYAIAGLEDITQRMYVSFFGLSFPKIPSTGRCLWSCTRAECSSPTCSSRGGSLKPRTFSFVINSTWRCGMRRLVFDCAGPTGHCSYDDADLAGSARRGPGGSAGDYPSVASLRVQSFLALEIPK
jgi:hypothetical protein